MQGRRPAAPSKRRPRLQAARLATARRRAHSAGLVPGAAGASSNHCPSRRVVARVVARWGSLGARRLRKRRLMKWPCLGWPASTRLGSRLAGSHPSTRPRVSVYSVPYCLIFPFSRGRQPGCPLPEALTRLVCAWLTPAGARAGWRGAETGKLFMQGHRRCLAVLGSGGRLFVEATRGHAGCLDKSSELPCVQGWHPACTRCPGPGEPLATRVLARRDGRGEGQWAGLGLGLL